MKLIFKFGVLFLVLLAMGCNDGAETGILRVEQAFTPVPPPGQKNAVAYLILENSGPSDVQILNVTSAVANETQVHRHTYSEGLMKMRKVNHAKVPAKGKLVFEAGGYHIMLMDLNRVLSEGEDYQLTFEFDNGLKLETRIPVTQR